MPTNDPFVGMNPGPNGPYVYGEAVTPSDSVEFAAPMRGLWIGGAGNITVTFRDRPNNPVLIESVAAGTELRMWVRKVHATGTTCTKIVALR